MGSTCAKNASCINVGIVMVNEVSLQMPQLEFVESFLQPEQLQRMLIYFSKQKATDSHAQYGFSDVIVRLINDPLSIIFGQHGVYLFSNYLLTYPYNELDAKQVAYVTQFLRMQIQSKKSESSPISPYDTPLLPDSKPSMYIEARVTKQMGGGYTVRPLQLTNIRLDTFDVLKALVHGVMCGSQKHGIKYREHAINLQLQRILTRITVSRAQLQNVNIEIEKCKQKQEADSVEEGVDTDGNGQDVQMQDM